MIEKNYYHLTLGQRCKIEALYKAGHKAPFIAKQLNVSPSIIYRELKRNETKQRKYKASFANMLAIELEERFSVNRKFTKPMEKLKLQNTWGNFFK